MTEPVACGCGGKAAIYINGDTTMQGYCTVCGTVGLVADSTSEAITAWNTAMSKDLRDAVDAVIQDIDCMSDNEVKDTLYAAMKGAK